MAANAWRHLFAVAQTFTFVQCWAPFYWRGDVLRCCVPTFFFTVYCLLSSLNECSILDLDQSSTYSSAVVSGRMDVHDYIAPSNPPEQTPCWDLDCLCTEVRTWYSSTVSENSPRVLMCDFDCAAFFFALRPKSRQRATLGTPIVAPV